MRTLKLRLAYDGTHYVGWQRQAAGVSVQGLVEEAFARVIGATTAVAGAGRTDAGVHALGQVASVRIDHDLPAPALTRAINAQLPPDVRLLDATDVPDSFHARFSASRKVYAYRLLNARLASPFERLFAWHCPFALDEAAISRALEALVGTHDFAAFRAAGPDVASTVRTLHAATLSTDRAWTHQIAGAEGQPILVFRFEADGFLRHMVRTLVGTAVEIGRGRFAPEAMSMLLASRDRGRAGPTAPPHGLFLVRVDYDDNLR